MTCRWIFFHKWGKWQDTKTQPEGTTAMFLSQTRYCEKCNRKQFRWVS